MRKLRQSCLCLQRLLQCKQAINLTGETRPQHPGPFEAWKSTQALYLQAQRLYTHLFNGGALSPEAAAYVEESLLVGKVFRHAHAGDVVFAAAIVDTTGRWDEELLDDEQDPEEAPAIEGEGSEDGSEHGTPVDGPAGSVRTTESVIGSITSTVPSRLNAT